MAKQPMSILSDTFPDDTFIVLGKRKLRTKAEADSQTGLDADELSTLHPESYPVTVLDVSRMNVRKVLIEGGTGYVVREQKNVRGLTTNQISNYRSSMLNKYPTIVDKFGPEPVHVINCRTVGGRIDLMPVDKLQLLEQHAPDLYNAVFSGLDEEGQLAIIDRIWDQFLALAKK